MHPHIGASSPTQGQAVGGHRTMFSKDLEQTIGQCYKRAREARHEFMTVEHLLLALLENPAAVAVLKACGVLVMPWDM